MDYENLVDERQAHVHENYSDNNYLGDKDRVRKLMDWITFWRRNPGRFVEHYFGLTLHLYQHIILFLMNIYPSICIVAARSAAKSFIIAIYSCKEAILRPGSRIVIASATKGQARLIVSEKIKKEILPNSPLLQEEIELLDGASAEYDLELIQAGELTPVFFGSALTNFGVEYFLQHFLQMTTTPLPRKADTGIISPTENNFSAFVFKIQANMNKAHRDRIAFMRICSGKYEASMEVKHVQGGKVMRLSQPQQIMASERKILEEAYAGDIIGVFDPGIFSIGDTLCMPKEQFRYEGIPTFAPEHFARVRQMDTMKRKQFVKGITQIAQEGAIQIFQEFNTGMEEIIVGVVGILQFDVLKYRLENEYNVEIRLEPLPYEHIRWIENKEIDLNKLTGTSDMKKVKDLKGNPLLLFVNAWSVGMTLDRNKGLVLSEFGRD